LTYALKLGLIRNGEISKNYVSYSDKIRLYCGGFKMKHEDSTIEDIPYTIEDFVREAMIEMRYSEYMLEPS
jgi:hypothetical protein